MFKRNLILDYYACTKCSAQNIGGIEGTLRGNSGRQFVSLHIWTVIHVPGVNQAEAKQKLAGILRRKMQMSYAWKNK